MFLLKRSEKAHSNQKKPLSQIVPFLILGGFSVSESEPHRAALVCVLDNLLKGAASQAVQNLNLSFGFHAMLGLGSGEGNQ